MLTEIYSRSADPAAPSGPNLSFTPPGGVEVKFRAPFTKSTTELDFKEAGVTHRVDAVTHVPVDLGLMFEVGSRLTYLADGTIYRVWRIVEAPNSGVIRLALKVPSLSS